MFSFSLQVSQAVHCLCACSPGFLILHIYTQTADQEGWSGCHAVSYVYTAVYTTLCLREAEVTAFMGMPWGDQGAPSLLQLLACGEVRPHTFTAAPVDTVPIPTGLKPRNTVHLKASVSHGLQFRMTSAHRTTIMQSSTPRGSQGPSGC